MPDMPRKIIGVRESQAPRVREITDALRARKGRAAGDAAHLAAMTVTNTQSLERFLQRAGEVPELQAAVHPMLMALFSSTSALLSFLEDHHQLDAAEVRSLHAAFHKDAESL